VWHVIAIPRVCGNWRRVSIALILLISVASPVVELFDRWDQSLQNDTEATVIIVALCVGVALVTARALTKPPGIQSSRRIAPTPTRHDRRRATARIPLADTGPPLILRL
jgi:hypothetical protein